MRAGVFRGKGRIEVEDVPDPVAGPDDVVLDLYGCGVCGSDIGQFRSGTARAGQVMGHEFAGTVVEVGSRVQGIVEGDRLTGLPIQPCGDCRRCRAGLAHLCERWTTRSIAFGLPGGFAERLHIPAARLGHNVHRLPDLPGGAGAALEAGTLVEPLSVAVHAVRLADAGPGRSAVVTGLGTIGLQAAQTLRAKGCTPVIGVDPSPLRRSVAEGLGIVTVDPTVGEALAGTLSALTGEAEADIVVEASGVGALVAGAIEIVRPRGTVVLVALYHSPRRSSRCGPCSARSCCAAAPTSPRGLPRLAGARRVRGRGDRAADQPPDAAGAGAGGLRGPARRPGLGQGARHDELTRRARQRSRDHPDR
ncbi:zinc-binding dehydrogenase [Pseudonocardia benzenivorans]